MAEQGQEFIPGWTRSSIPDFIDAGWQLLSYYSSSQPAVILKFSFAFVFSPKWSPNSPLMLRLDLQTIHQVAFSHLFPPYLFCLPGQSGGVLTPLQFVTLESLV